MNLAELTELLMDVGFLDVKEGKLVEPPNNANKNKPKLFSMTIAELREIDPRIPAAIEGQLAITKEILEGDAKQSIWGNLFRRTLMIWQNMNMIPTIEAGPVAYDCLWDFGEVKLGKKKQGVQLAVFGGRVRDFTSSEGESIKLSERTIKETFTICPKWLEDNYPAWQNRYLAATALGYEGQELVDYVLPESLLRLSTLVMMDSVTFD